MYPLTWFHPFLLFDNEFLYIINAIDSRIQQINVDKDRLQDVLVETLLHTFESCLYHDHLQKRVRWVPNIVCYHE